MSSADRFMEACWGRNPLQVEVSSGEGDGAKREVLEFAKPYILIGRSFAADIDLPDPKAPRQQLYFQLLNGRLFAASLSDVVPTYCGQHVWKHGWVKPTHVFDLGGTRIRVLNPDHRPPGSDNPMPDPLSTERAYDRGYSFLLPPSRRKIPEPVQCRKEILITGRSAPSRFLIRHKSVHSVHAAFVYTATGLWVVDLSLKAAVSINGVVTSAGPLQPEDKLTLGTVNLGVRLTDEAGSAPPPGAMALEYPPIPVPPSVPAIADNPLGAVLEQVARIQRQNNDQMREMMATMMNMFGTMMANQQQFVREELDRIERILVPRSSAVAPPPTPTTPLKPLQGPVEPPKIVPPLAPAPSRMETPSPTPTPALGATSDALHLHGWLEKQLGSLDDEQQGLWQKFMGKLGRS